MKTQLSNNNKTVMKEQKQKKTSRRSFFRKGILAGVGAMLGITSVNAATNEEEEEETVKMLTPDGKLVEVPKKALPQKSGKVVSNRELFEWREKHK
ncbi:MAG: hypothetical protein KDC75_23620 [Phaeodactylibacter sp.]|nr:hypothetical protein [Phaeodactylibacter sp.]